jgi:hypothetical protein
MPTITAVPVPVPGYVYVEADFSDVGTATAICVDRVHPDGTRFPLRPYVSYDADGCLNASCGLGIWWDTELPFDTEVTYCATGNDAAGDTILTPAAPLVADTFTRVEVASWGTPDIGPPWTVGPTPVDFAATGTRGQTATTVVSTDYIGSLVMATPNADAQVTAFPAAVALTATTEMQLWLRSDGTSQNGYRAIAQMQTGGTVHIRLQRVVAGVITTLAFVNNIITYTAASAIGIRLRVWGSQLDAMIWDATGPQPAAFQVSATDTVFTGAGTLNLLGRRNGGNTNGPIDMQWDNLLVADVCAVPVPLEVCSTPVTIANDGCFRLGDPVRPCNDRPVCFTEEDCPPEPGIYFGSMGEESYADNSGQLLPVNASRAVTVSRERRDTASQLNLVTASFTDRDDLLVLLAPGSPLLWRGPAQYGTKDRYMSIFDVGVTRSFSDHREEPRVFTMPWTGEDPPVGPSLGVCGTRITDLCDVYPTWDALIAAGLTYADLLRGYAGTGVSAPLAVWNDVNADFADWTALDAGEADWDDTLTGFP